MATFKQRLGIGDQKKLEADILAAIESYEGKVAENVDAANEARTERLSLTKIQTATEHDRIAAESARDGMYEEEWIRAIAKDDELWLHLKNVWSMVEKSLDLQRSWIKRLMEIGETTMREKGTRL